MGTTAQTITGTVSRFQNLTVANPVGVTAERPVQMVQVLRTTNNLASGGNVTLLSSAAGTALIAEAGGQVTGDIKMQRYIDPSLNSGPGYRHYGTPVSGSTVNDLATTGFSPIVNPTYNTSPTPGQVSPFPTVYSYDQGRIAPATSNYSDFDKGWTSPNSLTNALTVGIGYTVNLPGTAPAQLVQAVAVFPNPATGSVLVSLPASLAHHPITTSLLSSLGQTVRRTVLPVGAAATPRLLSLSGVAPGVYSLRLETADGAVAKRLVITH